MRRCDANEHFYDENKHSGCPHCAGVNATVKLDNKKGGDLPKPPKQQPPSGGPKTVGAWVIEKVSQINLKKQYN
jgi:hypothetical protein